MVSNGMRLHEMIGAHRQSSGGRGQPYAMLPDPITLLRQCPFDLNVNSFIFMYIHLWSYIFILDYIQDPFE